MKAKDRVSELLEKLLETMEPEIIKEYDKRRGELYFLLSQREKIPAALMLAKILPLLESEKDEDGSPIDEALREVEAWEKRLRDLPQIPEGERERAHYILRDSGIQNGMDKLERRGVLYALGKVIEILKKEREAARVHAPWCSSRTGDLCDCGGWKPERIP